MPTILGLHPETLFSLASNFAMAGWLLLAILPGWRWTQRILISGFIPLLALTYLVCVIPGLREAEGGFGSLKGVGQLFDHPLALLAGWIHYLAFDLFIGAWEIRDSRHLGIPHLLVLPCLALTLLLGPVGLLAYLLLRLALRRSLDLTPAP